MEAEQPKKRAHKGVLRSARSLAGKGVSMLHSQLRKHSFKVSCTKSNMVHHGMRGINFVHQLMDIKTAFNINDEAMKTLVSWITTKLVPWEHTLPSSWYKFKKLLNPRNIEDTRHHVCPCQGQYWGPDSTKLPKKVLDAAAVDNA